MFFVVYFNLYFDFYDHYYEIFILMHNTVRNVLGTEK